LPCCPAFDQHQPPGGVAKRGIGKSPVIRVDDDRYYVDIRMRQECVDASRQNRFAAYGPVLLRQIAADAFASPRRDDHRRDFCVSAVGHRACHRPALIRRIGFRQRFRVCPLRSQLHIAERVKSG
jgi:putative aminopeptidase FrvX